jgi:hypothetical protein
MTMQYDKNKQLMIRTDYVRIGMRKDERLLAEALPSKPSTPGAGPGIDACETTTA